MSNDIIPIKQPDHTPSLLSMLDLAFLRCLAGKPLTKDEESQIRETLKKAREYL